MGQSRRNSEKRPTIQSTPADEHVYWHPIFLTYPELEIVRRLASITNLDVHGAMLYAIERAATWHRIKIGPTDFDLERARFERTWTKWNKALTVPTRSAR